MKDEKFIRDASGAVISVDRSGLAEYKARKRKFNEVTENSKRLDKVETDIGEIKELLKALLAKGQ